MGWCSRIGGIVAVLRSKLPVLEMLLRVLLEVALVRVRRLADSAHVTSRRWFCKGFGQLEITVQDGVVSTYCKRRG